MKSWKLFNPPTRNLERRTLKKQEELKGKKASLISGNENFHADLPKQEKLIANKYLRM